MNINKANNKKHVLERDGEKIRKEREQNEEIHQIDSTPNEK